MTRRAIEEKMRDQPEENHMHQATDKLLKFLWFEAYFISWTKLN